MEFERKGKAAHLAFISTDERALLAVQGPEMSRIIQPGLKDSLDKLHFMQTTRTSLYGFDHCRITRCGYTGEDGVEISCLSKDALPLCEILLSSHHGNALLAGLGARDSLRLEAGLCLYGNDIDENTTPIEAGLTWTIGKRRRIEKGFPGADKILSQIKNGVNRKRVGLISVGAPLRKGYEIVDSAGNQVGTVTSGCPSPSIGKNIAMAYVSTPFSKIGTELGVKVRNKVTKSEVVKMPFLPTHYFQPKGHAKK